MARQGDRTRDPIGRRRDLGGHRVPHRGQRAAGGQRIARQQHRPAPRQRTLREMGKPRGPELHPVAAVDEDHQTPGRAFGKMELASTHRLGRPRRAEGGGVAQPAVRELGPAGDVDDVGISVVPVRDARHGHCGFTLAAVPLAKASSRALAASCVFTTPATTASA